MSADLPTIPGNGIRTFVALLVNTAVANVSTSFMWFGLTFWIYIETRNVLSTALIGAALMLFVALTSMFFGTLVDRYRKKPVMAWGTGIALVIFVADAVFFFAVGADAIADLSRPWFWIFAVVMLAGAVIEQLRSIAMSTAVTLLVPDARHANANGAVGAVEGLSMLVTSVLSGLAIGFLGMGWTLVIGISAVAIAFCHLLLLRIDEPRIVRTEGDAAPTGWVDLRGGWRAVRAADGLLFLIFFFSMLNNFIGGVYMALIPAVEAAEQTVIQRVVPYRQQGRVFGFARMFEAAAAPVTSLMIGPLAEFLVIPYMRTDAGQAKWAWLLGEGDSRGSALIFVVGGFLAVVLALGAMLMPQYRSIVRQYARAAPPAHS
ncbi:MAG: MFS transporter [Microbacterium gubbeenense]|uniref:MFS transporter n=1 Tax=Microbacterium gubbeenense TaxID=159896 RepID=UPI003F97F252